MRALSTHVHEKNLLIDQKINNAQRDKLFKREDELDKLISNQKRVLAQSELSTKPIIDALKAREAEFQTTAEQVQQGRETIAHVKAETVNYNKLNKDLSEQKMELM